MNQSATARQVQVTTGFGSNGETQFGNELVPEIYIGNLLQLLCPGSLNEQLAACRHFSLEAPLLAHHLVRQNREVQNSILGVELELPHRVVAWISDDHRPYALDCPFVVERPAERLDQVVLSPETLRQARWLVEQAGGPAASGDSGAVVGGQALTMLEYGPSGTGKTLLARALASHAGRPLVLLNRQATGSRREPDEVLPDLFREARLQHGIVFIDECDELCGLESPWLRPLLTELERSEAPVILATNRPEVLAPALDRRCTVRLAFAMPDAQARQRIWDVHLAGIRCARSVDLERLGRAYPLTGGYIRNAVLTARQASIAPDGLTQADLEEAAQGQMRQAAGRRNGRELVVPRWTAASVLLAEAEKASLRRLAQMARGGLVKTAAAGEEAWVTAPHRGLKVLVHGPSYDTVLQAAEALAGELGVLLTRVTLDSLLQSESGDGDQPVGTLERLENELLAGLAGADHVLVVTDACGRLSGLREEGRDPVVRRVFAALGGYAGVAVVATAAERPTLPDWAQVFQEELGLHWPDAEVRTQAWRHLAGETLKPGEAARLAEVHDLDVHGIQAAVHRARLRAATSEGQAPWATCLDSAAAGRTQGRRGVPVLFG